MKKHAPAKWNDPKDRAPVIDAGESWPFVREDGLFTAVRPFNDRVPEGVSSFFYKRRRLVPLYQFWRFRSR